MFNHEQVNKITNFVEKTGQMSLFKKIVFAFFRHYYLHIRAILNKFRTCSQANCLINLAIEQCVLTIYICLYDQTKRRSVT